MGVAMMDTSLRDLALQQLANLDSSAQIIVLHPSYVEQHVLLNYFLQETSVFYIRFHGKDLSHTQLVHQFEAEWTAQQGESSLNSVKYLVLDEFDRANIRAFDPFLNSLIAKTDSRLVLLTRSVPSCLLDNPHLRQRTRYIPVEKDYLYLDYGILNGEQAVLQVFALGGGTVLVNGRVIEDWEGVLPQLLFFYMVDRGMVTRNQIFETFWPEMSVKEATNVFHVTKRKINEVLGMDLTTYWSGYYHLSPKINLFYDAALFSEQVQNSVVASSEDALRLLQQALFLYHGDFLTLMPGEWVTRRRHELRQTYGEALISLARMLETSENNKPTLGLYLQALKINPRREDVARGIMSIYRDLGMYDDALLVYQRLEEELDKGFGVSPAPQIQTLALAIREALRERQAV
jgi:DNA-binding SARP family transcriptional activator